MEVQPQQSETSGAETGREHEGERYLRMLGLSEHADREITTTSGRTLQLRDFLEVCGPHARMTLVGLELTDRNDPDYAATVLDLHEHISLLLNPGANS